MAHNNDLQTGDPRVDFTIAGASLLFVWLNSHNIIELAKEYEPVIRIAGTLISVAFAALGYYNSRRKKKVS